LNTQLKTHIVHVVICLHFLCCDTDMTLTYISVVRFYREENKLVIIAKKQSNGHWRAFTIHIDLLFLVSREVSVKKDLY
jgi:hypothetical protein